MPAIKTGRLPNFLIIGAQKCGTTSMHHYLSKHPQIFMAKRKELNFFNKDKYWDLGVEWYRSQFESTLPIAGESTPCYTAYPYFSDVPERMAHVIPDAKFLYLVRDPIERIVSQYCHYQALRGESRSLEQAVFENDKDAGYLIRSRYYSQIERYLKYFDLDQFLIVSSRDLNQSTKETVSGVCKFLGVTDEFDSDAFSVRLNQSRQKRKTTKFGRELSRAVGDLEVRIPLIQGTASIMQKVKVPWSKPVVVPTISESLRQRLVEELLPDITKFRELTGQSFSDWSL